MPFEPLLFTAMITPFDRDGELDTSAIRPFLRFQRAAGIDGVVVAGTNGEGPSLSGQERKTLLEYVLEIRGGLKVMAGTGAASLPEAIDFVQHASRAGADSVLVLPPYYFKNVSVEGLASFYRKVLDASEAPVYLYSIPHQSAIAITDELLDLLQGHPRLAGLKDSGGDWGRTSALIERYPNLKVFSGGDGLLSRCMSSRAAGAISGTANAFPELLSAVRRASEKDRWARQARLDEARLIVADYPLVAANKSVLARRGLPRMYVRPPLIDLTPEQEAEMAARLESAGLSLEAPRGARAAREGASSVSR